MTDRTEVQFILETTTRCGGSCQGCFLTASERTHGDIWSMERFLEAGRFIGGYLDEHLKDSDPKEISINLGQGDHLLAGPEKLAEIVRWIHDAGRGRAFGFMTASAIGRADRIARTVDAVRDVSLELSQPILFDLVIDPVKTTLPKFRSVYAANIEYVRQAFGGVDLHVNVGPDTVGATSPEALMDFLAAAGIRRFTLNFTPTPASAAAFAASWTDISTWICRFLEVWSPDTGVELNVGQVLSAVIGGSADLRDEGVAALGAVVAHAAARTVFINGDGMIYHAQAGVGDVPCSDRVGMVSKEAIPTDPADALGAVARSARRLASAAIRSVGTRGECVECEFAAVCPRIGAAAIISAMGGRMPGTCPSGLFPILKTVSDGGGKGTMDVFRVHRNHSHLPRGFRGDARPNAVPLGDPEGMLSFDRISGKA